MLQLDSFQWTHPTTKATCTSTVYVDEGSTKTNCTIYGVAPKGERPPSVTATRLNSSLAHDWYRHSGKPVRLRADAAG